MAYFVTVIPRAGRRSDLVGHLWKNEEWIWQDISNLLCWWGWLWYLALLHTSETLYGKMWLKNPPKFPFKKGGSYWTLNPWTVTINEKISYWNTNYCDHIGKLWFCRISAKFCLPTWEVMLIRCKNRLLMLKSCKTSQARSEHNIPHPLK